MRAGTSTVTVVKIKMVRTHRRPMYGQVLQVDNQVSRTPSRPQPPTRNRRVELDAYLWQNVTVHTRLLTIRLSAWASGSRIGFLVNQRPMASSSKSISKDRNGEGRPNLRSRPVGCLTRSLAHGTSLELSSRTDRFDSCPGRAHPPRRPMSGVGCLGLTFYRASLTHTFIP